MTAIPTVIDVYRGDDIPLTFTIYQQIGDGARDVLDLTGAIITVNIKGSGWEEEADILNASAGTCEILVPAAITTDFSLRNYLTHVIVTQDGLRRTADEFYLHVRS